MTWSGESNFQMEDIDQENHVAFQDLSIIWKKVIEITLNTEGLQDKLYLIQFILYLTTHGFHKSSQEIDLDRNIQGGVWKYSVLRTFSTTIYTESWNSSSR